MVTLCNKINIDKDEKICNNKNMSYEENDDLFLKAQKNDNADYVAFVLDIKNSKTMSKKIRYSSQLKSFNTINLMIKYFNFLENKTKTKILVDGLPVIKTNNITKPKIQMLNYLNNPCVAFGDSFAFYCYNNTISKEKFINIFKYCAKICNNDTKYHLNYGKFETLYYNEANEQYYLGYALEKLSKEKSSEENLF